MGQLQGENDERDHHGQEQPNEQSTAKITTAKSTDARDDTSRDGSTEHAPAVHPNANTLTPNTTRPAFAPVAEATRSTALGNEIPSFRRHDAPFTSHGHGHWPNLSHIPPTPSLPEREDPTGYHEEEEIFYMGVQLPRKDKLAHKKHAENAEEEMMPHNKGETALQVVAKYERMLFGAVEARDGNEVLDHDGGMWMFRKILGSGGYGIVALWEKVDGITNEVIDVSSILPCLALRFLSYFYALVFSLYLFRGLKG